MARTKKNSFAPRKPLLSDTSNSETNGEDQSEEDSEFVSDDGSDSDFKTDGVVKGAEGGILPNEVLKTKELNVPKPHDDFEFRKPGPARSANHVFKPKPQTYSNTSHIKDKEYVEGVRFKQHKLQSRKAEIVDKQFLKTATFFFVSHGDKTVVSETMKAAFDLLANMKAGFKIKWITEMALCEKIDNIKTSDGPFLGIYVLDQFDDPLYDSLCELRARIFGPLAILQTYGQEHLPIMPNPIISFSMRKMVVTLSQIPNKDKPVLINRIRLMSGVVEKAFKLEVTHLISDTLVSDKSKVAREKGIPIISPKLVERCWELSERNEMVNAETEIAKFKLPLFHGFSISATQVSFKECLNDNYQKHICMFKF